MGTSGDHAVPAASNASDKSLFRKQDHREAKAPDYGTPGESLFRKNSLDEMTVGRTEKPVQGKAPAKPDDLKPLVRHRAGIGSYEDPADQKRGKRSRKTGRPGRWPACAWRQPFAPCCGPCPHLRPTGPPRNR
jgi:excinuclease ABC subunit B